MTTPAYWGYYECRFDLIVLDAFVLVQKGTCERTIEVSEGMLRRAVTDGERAAIRWLRGVAYRRSGELHKAIAEFNLSIRLNPKMTKAYRDRGYTFTQEREWEKAIADYTEAIRLSQRSVWTYCARGYVLTEKGDLDKAIADYTEAIKLDPRNAEAFFGRGGAYDNKGNKSLAAEDFTRAEELGHYRKEKKAGK